MGRDDNNSRSDNDGIYENRSLHLSYPPPPNHHPLKKQSKKFQTQLTVTAKGQLAVHLITEVKREHLT
jgi:hypothetical protein